MRILHLAHNDPRFHPGGTEIFARDLFEEMADRPGVEALFVAATDRLQRPRSPGTPFQTVGRSAREMLLWTGAFDRFNLSQTDTHGVLPELERLVREFRPDVVLAQHVLLLGLEAFAVIRRAAPAARIVLTLHDYYPICHGDGVMVRTAATGSADALCREASPDRCRQCFPDISVMNFRLRELYIRRHLGLVDRFVAPSRFLADRYIAWGLDPARVSVVRNGRRLPPPAALRPAAARAEAPSFALFGNLSPMKGTLVALEAALIAARHSDRRFSVTVHGAPLYQVEEFTARLGALADVVNATGRARVRLAGLYQPEDVPDLMEPADWVIVPSVWWENAPLVIQEAFHHGRPVLCSNIGGMKEAVEHGVTGLHFTVGDPGALAERMLACIGTPELWDRLHGALPKARGIAACADEYLAMLGEDAPAPQGAPAARRNKRLVKEPVA